MANRKGNLKSIDTYTYTHTYTKNTYVHLTAFFIVLYH